MKRNIDYEMEIKKILKKIFGSSAYCIEVNDEFTEIEITVRSDFASLLIKETGISIIGEWKTIDDAILSEVQLLLKNGREYYKKRN